MCLLYMIEETPEAVEEGFGTFGEVRTATVHVARQFDPIVFHPDDVKILLVYGRKIVETRDCILSAEPLSAIARGTVTVKDRNERPDLPVRMLRVIGAVCWKDSGGRQKPCV